MFLYFVDNYSLDYSNDLTAEGEVFYTTYNKIVIHQVYFMF